MGRKTQITKEQMLEAGLQIVIKEGYGAISIKNLAAKLGSSTTPITWTFNNIESYRRELRDYAVGYVKTKLTGGKDEPVHYKKTIEVYLDMAIEEPNLLLYLRSDKETMESLMSNRSVFDEKKNAKFRAKWAMELNMTEADALSFIQFLSVYMEGVVSLLLSDVEHMNKKTAREMLDEAEVAYQTYVRSKTKD